MMKVKKIKQYFMNLGFCLVHGDMTVNIEREHVTGRGFYGRVTGFDFKTGKINVAVFDFGVYFPRQYDRYQLEG
jgi:hypothetical protein